MQKKDPEGYRKLLAYQKCVALHKVTLEVVRFFPKTKTFYDLADQMARSGRSGHKNIVEGWKRNTTQEYFDFLGFSIGAVEELKDDAADVATGMYEELKGLKGVMGNKWVKREALDALSFYPLPQNLDPAVEIFLRAKEANYLLYKLQKSLDIKMDNEHTKPSATRYKNYFEEQKQADKEFEKNLADAGLLRLENGQYVTKVEWEKRGRPPLFPSPL